ncbi:cytochrome P450 [Aspergillus karnatakaensis]|uniref:cytochrome P450 n=1 Tax=Aspergillus karnatakaensis TaxID=1810916 RepID=UPI003CCD0474
MIATMDLSFNLSTISCIALIAPSILIYLLNKLTTWEHIVPPSIRWIDRRPELLSYIRSKARSFFAMRENVIEAYKLNKEGHPVALAIAFGRPQIVLPPKYIKWIVDQPESKLSIDPIHNEFHAFLRDGLVGDHMVQEVMRKELAVNLAKLTEEMNEEIVCSLEDVYGGEGGGNGEWKTLPLKDSMRIVTARISNRLFVGKELGRNEEYLKHAIGVGMAVMPQTVVQDLIPRPLKRPLSFATKIFTSFSLGGFTRLLRPVAEQRVREVQGVAGGEGDTHPHELLTWMARRAVQRGESPSVIIDRLIFRIAATNLASIETTTDTVTKCLQDITKFSEEGGKDYLERMREEARTVFESCNYAPAKADIDKLVHIENALKESLRLGAVLPALIRQVTTRTGLTLDDGTHLPFGARISVAAYAIHRDEDKWTDATTYNPSRHEQDGLPMSRASERFLSFGLGKRACPGRFFVTDEMKLLFAHLLVKYEFRVVTPPRTKVGLLQELAMRGPQEQLVIRQIK